MKFKLYLAVGGADFDAERFRQNANIGGSTVKQIGQRGQEIDPSRFRKWNVWESPRIAGSNDPGDDILKLITDNAAAVSLLQVGKSEDSVCWVGIVCYYLEDEAPRGFSFDSNTIKMLADIRASIEIDAVYDAEEIQKYQRRSP